MTQTNEGTPTEFLKYNCTLKCLDLEMEQIQKTQDNYLLYCNIIWYMKFVFTVFSIWQGASFETNRKVLCSLGTLWTKINIYSAVNWSRCLRWPPSTLLQFSDPHTYFNIPSVAHMTWTTFCNHCHRTCVILHCIHKTCSAPLDLSRMNVLAVLWNLHHCFVALHSSFDTLWLNCFRVLLPCWDNLFST